MALAVEFRGLNGDSSIWDKICNIDLFTSPLTLIWKNAYKTEIDELHPQERPALR